MKVRAATLDDLLNEVFRRVIATGNVLIPSKGKIFEKTGAILELTNPRARMSRTESRCLLYAALGELLWYLSGSNDLEFIRYYIKDYPSDGPDEPKVRAAYGPRLIGDGNNKLEWIIDLLKKKRETRRAVIPIYQVIDCITDLPEVPCTCTLQFLVRRERLEMIVHMRSNDAYMGLPGDVFAFTMIQEIVARALNIEMGRYKHLVGSLHLYERDARKAKHFIDEGWQSKTSMPLMPRGDQQENMRELLRLEQEIRNNHNPIIPSDLPMYWAELAQLLKIYRADKNRATTSQVKTLRKGIKSSVYNPYIDKRLKKAEKRDREIQVPSEQRLFT